MKPFIAKDTKKPLVVLGGYEIASDGGIMRNNVPPRVEGKDYGSDPIGDGMVRMVPSGEIVTAEEAIRRLSR